MVQRWINFRSIKEIFNKKTEVVQYSTVCGTGGVAVALYSVLGFFMIAFYQSNLRAHLTIMDLEKLIDTDEDVADSGKLVYIPKALYVFE